MSKDNVKQYQQAVAALQLEKASLQKDLDSAQATVASAEKRLAEIESALGGSAKFIYEIVRPLANWRLLPADR